MKKIKEEELLKTPVFTVVKKTFDEAKFNPVGLNCNDWVMVLITDKPCYETDAKAIFVKQTRWGLEDKTIEFPCGTCDPEDFENIVGKDKVAIGRLKAALREVKEETGIDVAEINIKHLITFNPNPAYFNNTMSIYQIIIPNLEEVFAKRGEQHLDTNEDCEVSLEKIADKVGDLTKNAMGIAALFAAGYHLD